MDGFKENKDKKNNKEDDLVKSLNQINKKVIHQFGAGSSTFNDELNKVTKSRENYYSLLSKFRNNYLVNSIYDIFINDIILDSSTDAVINIEVPKNPKIQDNLNELFKNLKISESLLEILPDLLHYGSYSLKCIVTDAGVQSIEDIYDAGEILPIYDSFNNPLLFVKKSRKVNGEYFSYERYEYLSVKEIISFNVGLEKIKIDLSNKETQFLSNATNLPPKSETDKILPNLLKVSLGKSIIYPVLDKIDQYLTVEAAQILNIIEKAIKPDLVGVSVGANYGISDVVEIVDKYEQMLNERFDVKDHTSLKNILKNSKRLKVIPITGDRGTLENISLRNDNDLKYDTSILKDLQEDTFNLLGIPYEFYKGEGTSNRENIKINVRYSKKIKRIQKSVVRSLKMLCLLHVSKAFPNESLTEADIVISLKNNVNVDEIENLESLDLLMSTITDVVSMAETLTELASESSKYEVNNDELLSAIKQSLQDSGSKYANMLVEKDKDKESDETDETGNLDN